MKNCANQIRAVYKNTSALNNTGIMDLFKELGKRFLDPEYRAKIEKEEIKCEKLSDYLHKIKNRTFKSRKSMMRDNIKMGKSLVDSENKINKEEPKEQKDDKSGNAGEKVNKFQKFMDKRDSKADPDVLGNFESKMSKEERAKLTRENLLNKLILSKKK